MIEQQPSKSKKPLHESFFPYNEYVLCRKIEIEEKVGHIILGDKEKWMQQREIVAVSPNLVPHMNVMEVGDAVIVPIGAREMFIQVDGEDLYFIRKADILCKIVK